MLADRAPERLAALGGGDPALLPLCDWKARTWPGFADDAFAPTGHRPDRPRCAGRRGAGRRRLRAIRRDPHDRLLVLPGPGLMRAVQCELTDPVSFALMAGRDRAHFVGCRAVGRRQLPTRGDGAPGVAGHRREGARPAVTEWMEAQARTALAGGETLGRLLTAAQAGLLAASLDAGAPELALTTAAVARRLGAGERRRRWPRRHIAATAAASERRPVPERLVWALRDLVCDLPAYAASR